MCKLYSVLKMTVSVILEKLSGEAEYESQSSNDGQLL